MGKRAKSDGPAKRQKVKCLPGCDLHERGNCGLSHCMKTCVCVRCGDRYKRHWYCEVWIDPELPMAPTWWCEGCTDHRAAWRMREILTQEGNKWLKHNKRDQLEVLQELGLPPPALELIAKYLQ